MSKRTKLTEEFVEALAASWEQHGDKVLDELAKTDGKAYARIVADLTPKQIEAKIETHGFDTMTSEQLTEHLIQGLVGDIERHVQNNLPMYERLVRNTKRNVRQGRLPPDGYARLSSRDKWLTDHGRPKLAVVGKESQTD